MRYLCKHDLKVEGGLVAVVANSEAMDFSKCRRIVTKDSTVESIDRALRLAFCLGQHDEVILDLVGTWNSEVVDGHFAHPFLEDVKVKVRDRR